MTGGVRGRPVASETEAGEDRGGAWPKGKPRGPRKPKVGTTVEIPILRLGAVSQRYP